MLICRNAEGYMVRKRLGTSVLDRSILLKFSLETRLDSKCFEPVMNFPVFLVLRSKTNKRINYLIMG